MIVITRIITVKQTVLIVYLVLLLVIFYLHCLAVLIL